MIVSELMLLSIITDSDRVDDIVRKFNSKYGEVKRYYMKFDVAVEVTL